MNNNTPLLQIKNMQVRYGAINAIRSINIEVMEGEIVTILGSNGAGKTTTLHAISGLIPTAGGEIKFNGTTINGLPVHKIVSLGIAQSPEGRLVFPEMTVRENLEMGAYLRKDKAEVVNDLDTMFSLFPVLKDRHKQQAGTLSGGEQQMLAMARAYMARPKLLLLDEPSLGIAPILTKAIFNAIVALNKKGTTILLVEQNAYAALKIAKRAYVLSIGEVSAQGTAEEILDNEEVKKAYLGH